MLEKSDIWRIRPTGGQPERVTFHDVRVTFPTLLDNRTLLYLATDDEGYGPWVYAMDVERRVPHRIFAGVDPITSLAASADGRRLVATVSRSTTGLWRVPIGDRVMEESGATPSLAPDGSRSVAAHAGPGTSSIVLRKPGGMASGSSPPEGSRQSCGTASMGASSPDRPLRPTAASRSWCKGGD